MKIHEILIERISIAQHTPALSDAVHQAIINIFNRKPAKVPQKMDMEFLYKSNTEFVNAIIPILTKFAKDKNDNDVQVKFGSLQKGTGKFDEETNTITITSKLLSSSIKLLFNHYTGESPSNTDTLIQHIVNRIVTIFSHELVHASQNVKGHKYEYKRGYIEPDKLKFFTALVKDQFNSPEEKQRTMDVYKSQPDEISAYATETASDLIYNIYKLPIDEQKVAIDVFLKTVSNHTYSEFKGRIEPEYKKVYRRYLKLIYQELADYKDKLHRIA